MFKVSQSDSSIFNLPQSYQTNQSQPVAQKSKFIVTQEPLLSMPKKKGKFLNLKRISSRIESDSSINGRWTREEHRRFIDAIITYGNDWKKIQNYVYSRSSTQARSHAQKFLLKLKSSEFFKKNKIDTTLSWAKTIQFLKNEYSNEELNEIFKSVTSKKKSINAKNNLMFDDTHTAFSTSTEADYSNTSSKLDEEYLDCDCAREKNKEEITFNDNEYIKTFIQSFTVKSDLDFDFNELNMVYCNTNKNTVEY